MYLSAMRTTVDIPDEQRAKLLKLAAQRGEKGFSRLIQEALDQYLDEEDQREQRIRDAISVLGTLDAEEAEGLDESVRRLRETWR
jgi:metal-responsive CopG/Arc/MetJ family transcriptional regulator